MVLGKQMNTRVSPEAYKSLLQKCADQGCSTYEYLRQLVHADVGLGPEGAPVQESEAEEAPDQPVQTELNVKNELHEGRIRITR